MKKRWSTILVWVLLFIISSGTVRADTFYTIQRGDTLTAIARRFGTTVQAIAEANSIINPNLIFSGLTLIIPDVSGPAGDPGSPGPTPVSSTYVVQQGDTLVRIAIRHGVTLQSLVLANNLDNPNIIFAGQTLIIPGVPPAPSPAPPATPVPATSTPVPPTPVPSTPVPSGPVGPNLLPNPSFEGGHYNLFGIPELQVPNSWNLGWDEGVPAPGTGVTFLRPESRVLARWFLPAHEHPLFIYDGDWTIKIFKGDAPISFHLFVDMHLEAGNYRFVANYFPDIILGYDGPQKIWADQALAGEVSFIYNGLGPWSAVNVGTKNTLVRDFNVGASGTVRLGVAFRTRYALPSNGFFADDWSLQRLAS